MIATRLLAGFALMTATTIGAAAEESSMAVRPEAFLASDSDGNEVCSSRVGGGRLEQPGSLRVKTGDYVQSGELLARVGVSEDSNLPHLHFEVTTSPNTFAGEGVPYVIEQYRVKTARDIWQPVTRELPMRDVLVDFGRTGGDAN